MLARERLPANNYESTIVEDETRYLNGANPHRAPLS
jgi:hypothetical protein